MARRYVSPRTSIGAVARRIAAFGALLERVLPPKKVPPIQSPEEAAAIRAYLVARVTGTVETFATDEPFRWALVQRVRERNPAIARHRQAGDADADDGVLRTVVGAGS